MTTTLSDMTATKQPELSDEEIAAKGLVRLAKEQGLSLTVPDGLLRLGSTGKSPVDPGSARRQIRINLSARQRVAPPDP